jgi:hypothetical protein
MAHESGQLVPGAVPVAGAGHMRTFAEMSAGAASLATLTGRAVMGWRWVVPWAVHTCAPGAFVLVPELVPNANALPWFQCLVLVLASASPWTVKPGAGLAVSVCAG